MKYIKNILGYIGIGLTLSCCGTEKQGGVISFLFAWTDKDGYILHQGHPYRVQLEYIGQPLITGTGLVQAQDAWQDPTQWRIVVHDELTLGDKQHLILEVDPALAPPPPLTCINYMCGSARSSTWLDKHLQLHIDPDNADKSYAYLGTQAALQRKLNQAKAASIPDNQMALRYMV